MKKLLIPTIVVIGLVFPDWAFAQDGSLDPTSGTYELVTGFAPDPQTLELTVDGTLDASSLGEQCVGTIAEAPDLRIVFTAGSLPLTVGANSDSDVTVVIQSPDETWHCNEDDPVHFPTPLSGEYNIWVGTDDPEPATAVVFFTELPN